MFVHQVELRRQTGLQRKAFQQAFAKSVNGLHPKPAGRFQRTGEQHTRHIQIIKTDIIAQTFFNGGVQGIIIQQRPCAQKVKQALLHFGSSRARIGEA